MPVKAGNFTTLRLLAVWLWGRGRSQAATPRSSHHYSTTIPPSDTAVSHWQSLTQIRTAGCLQIEIPVEPLSLVYCASLVSSNPLNCIEALIAETMTGFEADNQSI